MNYSYNLDLPKKRKRVLDGAGALPTRQVICPINFNPSSQKNRVRKQVKSLCYTKKASHILLVEYFPIVQEYLGKFVFSNLGYETTVAKNGMEALKLANQSFDLIFLGMGLPDIKSLDLLHRLRSIQKSLGIYIPIVVNLGTVDLEDNFIPSCLAAGADQIFTGKNCEHTEFKSLLEATLQLQPHERDWMMK